QLRGDVPRELSPHWEGLNDQRRSLVRIVPVWMVVLFTFVCLVVMYSGFAWMLGEQRDTVLQPYQPFDQTAVQPQSQP
ncbi:DotU family type IV/VI secretion system protein, partial [Pseudomonas sp. LJDD11]